MPSLVGKYLEVAGRIVQPISVDMMHDFAGPQFPPEFFFLYPAMNQFPAVRESPVAVAADVRFSRPGF
jgi:hypothetical protein